MPTEESITLPFAVKAGDYLERDDGAWRRGVVSVMPGERCEIGGGIRDVVVVLRDAETHVPVRVISMCECDGQRFDQAPA